jgi:hypothetical protein
MHQQDEVLDNHYIKDDGVSTVCVRVRSRDWEVRPIDQAVFVGVITQVK